MQQRASGDGLDGLAQTHLIGQQRPLGERQVQHAFALIGEERNFGFLRGPFPALHLQLVLAPKLYALGRALPQFQPRTQFLRQPQVRRIPRRKVFERLNGFFDGPVVQPPAGVEPGLQCGRHWTVAVEQAQRVAGRVRHNVQPRGPVLGRCPEQAPEPALEVQQHRFDMFTGAQPVDPKINTVTRELTLAHLADFDRVGQPAAGLYTKVGEDGVAWVQV